MTTPSRADRPIAFAGATLDRHRHVCAFFTSLEEEHRVMGPFIKEGIDREEKAFHIVDPEERAAYLRWLAGLGIDITAAQQRGQFALRNWEDAYLREGHFDQDAMLALIQEVLNAGKTEGYPLTRLVAHMEWALEDRPGVDDLVVYETRLNFILPKYKDPVIWLYDTAKFGGGVIMDILRTHPMAIVGGTLQENPFFVPPDQFLLELRERDRGAG
jgi:hypothetical protein